MIDESYFWFGCFIDDDDDDIDDIDDDGFCFEVGGFWIGFFGGVFGVLISFVIFLFRVICVRDMLWMIDCGMLV